MVHPSPDDYFRLMPDNSHKSKHRIIVKRDSKDLIKVLTGLPVLHNETKQLILFVELKWKRETYNR